MEWLKSDLFVQHLLRVDAPPAPIRAIHLRARLANLRTQLKRTAAVFALAVVAALPILAGAQSSPAAAAPLINPRIPSPVASADPRAPRTERVGIPQPHPAPGPTFG